MSCVIEIFSDCPIRGNASYAVFQNKSILYPPRSCKYVRLLKNVCFLLLIFRLNRGLHSDEKKTIVYLN